MPPLMTLAACHAASPSTEHTKRRSVGKFVTSHGQTNLRQVREPHFPLPNPPSRVCTPPHGPHSSRASQQLLARGWQLLGTREKRFAPLLSVSFSAFDFLRDDLSRASRAQVSPGNSFWPGNRHLLPLIAGRPSHATLH